MFINFFDNAKKFALEAHEADTAGNYVVAKDLYIRSASYFMTAIKHEKMPGKKNSLAAKAKEIITRAEQLKAYLKENTEPSSNEPNPNIQEPKIPQETKRSPVKNVTIEKSPTPRNIANKIEPTRAPIVNKVNSVKPSQVVTKTLGSKRNAQNTPNTGCEKKMKKDKPAPESKPNEENFEKVLQSAIIEDKPNVKWSDVAGLETAKAALKEAVVLPLQFPQLFVGKREPWKGILLYGPPGTGKSFLAKAVATESKATFFSISSSDLISKYLGESEKLVRSLFELARKKKPSIIFIDEFDSLCGTRTNENESINRVKTEFLVQMNGVGKDVSDVLVLAATNLPWVIDSAIRRRLERRIYIPLPEPEARKQILQSHIGDTPHELSDDDFNFLIANTEGYSGSDISILVRSALMEPVRRCLHATHFKQVTMPDAINSSVMKNYMVPCSPQEGTKMSMFNLACDLLTPNVSRADFKQALQTSKPSVCKQDLQKYVDWTKEFGQDG